MSACIMLGPTDHQENPLIQTPHFLAVALCARRNNASRDVVSLRKRAVAILKDYLVYALQENRDEQ